MITAQDECVCVLDPSGSARDQFFGEFNSEKLEHFHIIGKALANSCI